MSNEYLPVRLSHLLRYCSVGAIVRGPEYLMTVKDIREWATRDGQPTGRAIKYVDQVRSALGIEQELREPPIAKQLDNGRVDGWCVPAVKFPTWMRCPSCGLLSHKPWKELRDGEKPYCQNKAKDKKGNDQCKRKPALEQVPWVLAHAEGHLADVPWHLLCHSNSKAQDQCRADWETPYIRLIDQVASNRRLYCGRCNAVGDFPDALWVSFGEMNWRQPWLPEAPEKTADPAVVLPVNDARIHSPKTSNALVIPPESRIRKGSIVDRLYCSDEKLKMIEAASGWNSEYFSGKKRMIAREFRCSVKDIENALHEIGKGYPLYGENITQGILLETEYQAFIEEIPDVAEDESFVTTHHTSAWQSMAQQLTSGTKPLKILNSIDNLIAVDRLKEIMVLRGFQRINGQLVPPDISGGSDWLPALELYGEGIFFTFKEETLSGWEKNSSLVERAETIEKRFAATGLSFEPEIIVSPRFLMLHTLAHLLIRELETEAGYPAASLKERIYCTAGILPMSGILIYVAVPDVVGSLGGLAELAAPNRFLPLLSSVFDHAEWCSLDPVCSEHEGMGPSLLNRAACHACALIPEPGCAYGNVLLDRIFLKGDVTSETPSFLECID